MKILKLKKHYKSNFSGEIAGFPDAEADHIIANGGGELYKGGEAAAVEVKAPGDAPIEQPKADPKAPKK